MNYIHEPRLFATFNFGKGVLTHTHLDNTLNGPLSIVTMNDGDAAANTPLNQYALFVQDDWRVSSRLTLEHRSALRPHHRLPVRPVA